MASPSEHRAAGESRPKKQGLRCGNVPEKGKFAGEPCQRLLLEKDPELGPGVRCDRCQKFHPIEEINQRGAEPINQDGERRKKMGSRKGSDYITYEEIMEEMTRNLEALTMDKVKSVAGIAVEEFLKALRKQTEVASHMAVIYSLDSLNYERAKEELERDERDCERWATLLVELGVLPECRGFTLEGEKIFVHRSGY